MAQKPQVLPAGDEKPKVLPVGDEKPKVLSQTPQPTTGGRIIGEPPRPINVAAPPPGRVTIANRDGQRVTLGLLEITDLKEPVGGWQELERVGNMPATFHDGGAPRATMGLSLIAHVDILDGSDVDDAIDELVSMGCPATDEPEPLPVQIVGDVPTPRSRLWIIQELGRDKREWMSGRSRTARLQVVTLTVEQFVPVSLVSRVSPRSNRDRRGRRRRRTITVRKGDSLRTIAIRELGSSRDWKRLRDWNRKKVGKRDPDIPLRVGMRLEVR